MATGGGGDPQETIPEIADIFEVLLEVAYDWQNIGLLLRISHEHLNCIKSDCPSNSKDCLREMIVCWRNEVDKPSWQTLADALSRLGHHRTVKRLLEKRKHVQGSSEVTQQELPHRNEFSRGTTGNVKPEEETRTSGEDEPLHEESNSSDNLQSATDGQLRPAFVCPCGQCSIESFVRRGCPKLAKRTSTDEENLFPYLDVHQMSKDQKKDLEEQLLSETESIVRSFATLVHNTCESLVKQCINPKSLALCVLALGSFSKLHQNQSPLFRDEDKEIRNAGTIHDIFLVLMSHMSFYNYGLLEHIIEHYGTQQDQSNLKKYKEDFKGFCQRRIFEVPPHVFGNESKKRDCAKVTLKLDERVQTLENIQEMERKVARILGLKPSTLYLCRVNEGCVQLLYLIPTFVAKRIFPLSSDQEAALHKACVLKLNWVSSAQAKIKGSIQDSATNEPGNAEHSSSVMPAASAHDEQIQVSQQPGFHRPLNYICRICYNSNPGKVELELNKCLCPQEHKTTEQISVLWSQQKCRWIDVRPMPKVTIPGRFILCNEWRCRGKNCTYAHNEEERNYWNSQLEEQHWIRSEIVGQDLQSSSVTPNMSSHKQHQLASQKSLPPLHVTVQEISSEDSDLNLDSKQLPVKKSSMPSISRSHSYKEHVSRRTKHSDNLIQENYKEKFKLLLWIEEDTHKKILKEKCDGSYTLVLFQAGLKKPPWMIKEAKIDHKRFGYIEGMKGDQIVYATQASEAVTLRFISPDNRVRTVEADILLESIHRADNRLYIALNSYNAIKLLECHHIPKKEHCKEKAVQFQFEIKHSYFKNLHKAIEGLSSEVIAKLLPEEEDFDQKFQLYRIPFPSYYSYLKLDRHQLKALQAAVFCKAAAPVLIAGPFGTGKTRLLAVATYYFLEECQLPVRVLVCAHHQASADTFMECYFGLMITDPQHPWKVNLTRLISEQHHCVKHEYSRWYKTIEQFEKMRSSKTYHDSRVLIITTFLTSLRLIGKFEPGYFTHILVDEGAQSREPEAVAPLCLANKDTKVIIAGDHCQVGPALLVLGEEAQEGKLGISLLERLHAHYYSKGEVAKCHWATLLTNYRNHNLILTLPSHLFYGDTIESRAKRKLHPGTHFPLLFVCSSVDENAQGTEEDKYPQEAEVVLQQVKKYTIPWPEKEWGPRDVNEICIMTTARNQVNEINGLMSTHNYRMLKKVSVLPTYLMQGREFQAVFLSTSEPTLSNFQVSNPTKSISDPYVFNTAITRAQSLVVSVGNPFTLLKTEQHMKEKYGDRGRCWTHYLTLCLQNDTIYFPDSLDVTKKLECHRKLRRVLQLSSQCTSDSILKAYKEDRQKLREPMPRKSSSGDEVRCPYTANTGLQRSSSYGPKNIQRSPSVYLPQMLQAFASSSHQDEQWESESVTSQFSFVSEASASSNSREHSSGYFSEESSHGSEITTIPLQQVVPVKPKKTLNLQMEESSNEAVVDLHSKESEDKLDLTTLKKPVTRKRYQQKFHHLLLMEKNAHLESTRRCSGRYSISVFEAGHTPSRLYDDSKGHIRYGSLLGYEQELDPSTIQSIKQSSGGGLKITDFPGCVECAHADIVHVRGSVKKCIWIAFDQKNITKLTSSFPQPREAFSTAVTVEFVFSLSFLNELHSALNYLPFEVIDKLVPTAEDFAGMSTTGYKQPSVIRLDDYLDEYQERVLHTIFNPFSNAVITLCGPSGSGVSQVLIASTYSILKDNEHTKVLVCTRQESSADSFLERYLKLAESMHDEKHANEVYLTRLIPTSSYKYNQKYKKWYDTLENMKSYKHLGSVRLVVTTCIHSLAFLKQKAKAKEGGSIFKPGFFTHTLVDEGSQMLEPELIASLCLANSKTKIIIGGNPFEVGPSQVVLSEKAKQYGLGKSLLERLHENYIAIGGAASEHSLTLLKSHRSHHTEILLPSRHFYDAPLHCSALEAKFHPLAKYPLVFVCSGGEETQCTEEQHAKLLLEEVTKYAKKENWPKEWGKATEKICIVVSGNEEKLLFQRMVDASYRAVKKVRIHSGFKFLEKEYRAIFMSILESALPDSEQSPCITKCLCNPYVLNTTLAHVQSVVVSVGNPFKLLRSEEVMVKKYGNRAKCWTEYLRLCLSNGTFISTKSLSTKLQELL